MSSTPNYLKARDYIDTKQFNANVIHFTVILISL